MIVRGEIVWQKFIPQGRYESITGEWTTWMDLDPGFNEYDNAVKWLKMKIQSPQAEYRIIRRTDRLVSSS